MGKRSSKPKPSEQEKMSAAVAVKEYEIFKNLYLGTDNNPGPLLKMRNQAQKEDFTKLFSSRAGADLMQKTKSSAADTYLRSIDTSSASILGGALTKGLGSAAENALKAKATQQTKVLAAARKQAASNQQSLSQSASIDSSLALAKYNAKQERRAQQLAMATDFVATKAGEYSEKKAYEQRTKEIGALGE